jgi:alcohol dehydrogenase (NADP+)
MFLIDVDTDLFIHTLVLLAAIGLGTWKDKHAQESAVTEALKAGYRHIDTAQVLVIP